VIKKSVLLCILLASLFLTGCYVQTDISVSKSDELSLENMIISINAGGGDAVVEAAVRHAFNILGIRDKFEISKFDPPEGFNMENYLRLKPFKPFPIKLISNLGDKISITPVGDQKRLVWEIEQRNQVFIDRFGGKNSKSSNEVFLVVKITFPGPVDMANTLESDKNTYTWRITKEQLKEPFKIQAIYR